MKRLSTRFAVVIAAIGIAAVQAPVHSQARELHPVKNVVQPRVVPFDLNEVKLLPGPYKTAQENDGKYLLDLDSDRLLRNFRTNAKFDTPGVPCQGWEAPDCEIRGHFVGHYLSALAMMYRTTGDKRYKDRLDLFVSEMAKCQQALGGGYLSAFPTSHFDKVEAREQVWAPYYVEHKIMAGMYDAYTLTGNTQALDVLLNMADYFDGRMKKFPYEKQQAILGTEYGGMNDIMYMLYDLTGDPKHLELAHVFDKMEFLTPLSKQQDNLTSRHGNTHIPIVEGAARRYEITGDTDYRAMSLFFWDRVVNTRTYCMGGSTTGERWREPNKLAGTLSGSNSEVCKTYNMLKLTRMMFGWDQKPEYIDFYERAFFNGILGTQNPNDGSQLLYYVPLIASAKKNWGSDYGKFWCCYGSGVENWAKAGDSIYFHDDDTLYVNLFVASKLNWTDKKVKVVQQTNFPEQQGTSLTVETDSPAKFAMKVHIPYWTTKGVTVKVNGEAIEADAKPTSYVTIDRTWKDGDRVDVEMPMSLHLHAMPDDANMVAVMYGPTVLVGLMDESNATPVFTGSHTDLSWIKPVEGKPLTFTMKAGEKQITLIPLYKVVNERYTTYWTVADPDSASYKTYLKNVKMKAEREARIIDRVYPGRRSEERHNLVAVKSQADEYGGEMWRGAEAPGYWSWDLKVVRNKPSVLSCRVWASADPGRKYDILVNGYAIASQTFEKPISQVGFVDLEYPVPAELANGKDTITVTFRPHNGKWAAVSECATLRAAK